jgi:hypothetical protein
MPTRDILTGQALGPGQVLGEQPCLLRREGGGWQQGGDPQHVRGQGQGGHQAQARHFQVSLIFCSLKFFFLGGGE